MALLLDYSVLFVLSPFHHVRAGSCPSTTTLDAEMPFQLWPLRRPVWQNPTASIAEYRGRVPGRSQYIYWDAVGPAREAFDQLFPRINQLLAEHQGPIPNSDFMHIGLYMVGPSTESAVPHIMFASVESEHRKKAKAILERSGLLREFPGLSAGQWSAPPHIGPQMQAADVERGRLRAEASFETPLEIRLCRQVGGSTAHRSLRVRFLFKGRSTVATTSATLTLDGKLHYVVPAHVFLPPSSPVGLDESNQDDSDCEFGGFETGGESEAEAIPTSADSPSDSGDSEAASLVSSQAFSLEGCSESSSSRSRLGLPALGPESPQHDQPAVGLSANVPFINFDLDYALVIPSGDVGHISTVEIPAFPRKESQSRPRTSFPSTCEPPREGWCPDACSETSTVCVFPTVCHTNKFTASPWILPSSKGTAGRW